MQLQAHPTARGELAAGITFTAFSGMAVITGITLTGSAAWPATTTACAPAA